VQVGAGAGGRACWFGLSGGTYPVQARLVDVSSHGQEPDLRAAEVRVVLITDESPVNGTATLVSDRCPAR
jgi:hypothetical protein